MFEGFTRTSLEEASTIFSVLSVGRGSTQILSRPAAPIPSVIETSGTGFIRSIAGAQMSPMAFLLASLREKFPTDYDRHQQTGEGSMQRAIKRVLDERFRGLEYRQNVRLKTEGKELTDLDFVVLEPAFGTIVLCQLKFQDLYGADIRAKGTRTGRLNKEVSGWLSSVRRWVDSGGAALLRSTLRLERNFPVNEIFFLTISRHYAYSLKSVSLGENAAFSTWLQFVNAIELMRQKQGDFRTLSGFCQMLREQNNAKDQAHAEEGDTSYKLTTVEFLVRRAGIVTDV